MAKEKLDVWFRNHKGYIDAVFLYDNQITTYAHIGQHSTGSINWLYSTKPAKPKDYRSLLEELTGIYSEYDLIVKSKLPSYGSTLKLLTERPNRD